MIPIKMTIKDLAFKKLIPAPRIAKKVSELAVRINEDYRDRTPVFLPVLNGSFIFASDLLKEITMDCRVSFVKMSSYQGTNSTGQIKSLIGHEESLFNQDIIIVEDIIDSGLTLQKMVEDLRGLGAKSVEVAVLLRKKIAREQKFDVRYLGFEIDDQFVVGYGLDYDGLGRNYPDIYEQVP
jgi:hypoxanthine phosphoribosyltransferase